MVTIPRWGEEPKLQRVGSCNHCGKCCLSMKLGGFMLESPCISRDEDRCKFYVDELQDGKYGHCLIFGRGNKPIAAVKDRFGNKITEEQIKWHLENCIEYPTVKDIEAGHKLLSECSYTFEVIS